MLPWNYFKCDGFLFCFVFNGDLLFFWLFLTHLGVPQIALLKKSKETGKSITLQCTRGLWSHLSLGRPRQHEGKVLEVWYLVSQRSRSLLEDISCVDSVFLFLHLFSPLPHLHKCLFYVFFIMWRFVDKIHNVYIFFISWFRLRLLHDLEAVIRETQDPQKVAPRCSVTRCGLGSMLVLK